MDRGMAKCASPGWSHSMKDVIAESGPSLSCLLLHEEVDGLLTCAFKGREVKNYLSWTESFQKPDHLNVTCVGAMEVRNQGVHKV